MCDFIERVSDWNDDETGKRSCTLTVKRKFCGGVKKIILETQHGSGAEKLVAEYKSGPLFVKNGHYDIYSIEAQEKKLVGSVRSPGWLSSISLMTGPHKDDVRGGVYFNSTSRDGKLMNLSVILPEIRQIDDCALTKYVHFYIGQLMRTFPIDISKIISGFLGELRWLEPLNGLNFSNLKRFSSENECFLCCNKVPTWNNTIHAYTLEFHGRAEVPSVHNFQLIEKGKTDYVLLQVGKFNKEKNMYNVDYRRPLTTLQAFSICVSVCSRTFVRD